MTDLAYCSARELVRMIREGAVSSRELLDLFLKRIDRMNGPLNAVVTLDRENAQKRAAEADEALARGERWGPLHGLPMTVKDGYNTAGMRTTLGLPQTAKYKPRWDATLVAKLKQAGAVIYGKTNLPLASFDWQCRHPKFGSANNPWDLERTPGGSSGGSAAALAAGFTPLEIGSDVAGSLRVPAHFCGVTALRPTEGWLSDHGAHQVPGYPRLTGHLVTCGPMARTVEDLSLAMTVLAGSDPHRWEIPPVVFKPDNPMDNLHGLKIAYQETLGGVPVCLETARVQREFLAKLEDAGCEVVEAAPEDFDFEEALELWGRVQGFVMSAGLPLALRLAPIRAGLGYGLMRLFFGANAMTKGLGRGVALGRRAFFDALTDRARFVAAMDRFLQDYDVFLTPVGSFPALKHQRPGKPIRVGETKLAYGLPMGMYNCPTALAGTPQVAIPVGFSSDGLPIGLQLGARRWRDARLLAITAAMEKLIATDFRPPGY